MVGVTTSNLQLQVFEPEEETTNLVEFASMLTIGKESQLALLIQSGDLSRASQLASATIIAIDQRTGRYPRAREKFKKKLIEVMIKMYPLIHI